MSVSPRRETHLTSPRLPFGCRFEPFFEHVRCLFFSSFSATPSITFSVIFAWKWELFGGQKRPWERNSYFAKKGLSCVRCAQISRSGALFFGPVGDFSLFVSQPVSEHAFLQLLLDFGSPFGLHFVYLLASFLDAFFVSFLMQFRASFGSHFGDFLSQKGARRRKGRFMKTIKFLKEKWCLGGPRPPERS